ncbi:MAG: hypothetical protein HQ522_16155 [Bacteroidetes bacterium]|nr:hypothetical protein [Bacteroidota bacterium]
MKIRVLHIMDKLSWSLENMLNAIGAVILTLLAYLAEIKGSIHVMWALMFFDLMVGLKKSFSIDKKRFKMDKFKNWLVFVLLSTAVIAFVFAVEVEMIMGRAKVYNGFTLLISAFILTNIIRNAEILTGRFIFTVLLDFVNERIKKWAGVDLKSYEKNKDDEKH